MDNFRAKTTLFPLYQDLADHHIIRGSLLLLIRKTQILSKDMSLDQFKELATNFIQRDPSLEPCLPLLDSEDDDEVTGPSLARGSCIIGRQPSSVRATVEGAPMGWPFLEGKARHIPTPSKRAGLCGNRGIRVE